MVGKITLQAIVALLIVVILKKNKKLLVETLTLIQL
jgi:hypothetical protein